MVTQGEPHLPHYTGEKMRQASKEKKRIVQEGYRRWKNAEEYTPCTAEDKPDYLATCGVYHRCDGLTEQGERIRRNENEHGDRRWVLHRTGCIWANS